MRNRKETPKSKLKAKPLKRLPKKLGDDAYAYTAALLEDVNSNFRVFAENQSILSDKVDGLTYEMGIVKEDITGIKISQELMREDISVLKQDVSELNKRMGSVETRQSRMETDIREIKQELKSIRSEMTEFRTLLSQKADIERFNRLEERVARIEQELQQRQ